MSAMTEGTKEANKDERIANATKSITDEIWAMKRGDTRTNIEEVVEKNVIFIYTQGRNDEYNELAGDRWDGLTQRALDVEKAAERKKILDEVLTEIKQVDYLTGDLSEKRLAIVKDIEKIIASKYA